MWFTICMNEQTEHKGHSTLFGKSCTPEVIEPTESAATAHNICNYAYRDCVENTDMFSLF